MSEKEKDQLIFEKYWDETYKREYYFDVKNQQSVWELPEDKNYKIVDKIEKESKNNKAEHI